MTALGTTDIDLIKTIFDPEESEFSSIFLDEVIPSVYDYYKDQAFC